MSLWYVKDSQAQSFPYTKREAEMDFAFYLKKMEKRKG